MQGAASRLFALLIAALAWVTFWSHLHEAINVYGPAKGVWYMVTFYSHWLNVLIAVVFTTSAFFPSRAIHPSLIGKMMIMTAILWVNLLVILGWQDFLHSSRRLRIQHGLVPLLVIIYWLVFVPKGRLRLVDPVLWTMLPLTYTAFVLVRGALTGDYRTSTQTTTYTATRALRLRFPASRSDRWWWGT